MLLHLRLHLRKIILTLFILLALLFDSTSTAHGQNNFSSNFDDSGTQRVIVQFRHLTPSFVRSDLHRRFAVSDSQIESLRAHDTVVIHVPKGREHDIANRYFNSLWVANAELDAIAQADAVPDDPYYGDQWGQGQINSSLAWDASHGEGVDIAILDTGIAQDHPDVSSKVTSWQNYTFSRSDYDRDGHGTHVAGIAAASTNNDLGIAGTAYNARLMSVKVLDDRGRGYYSWIINGIYYAVDNGAEVINLSLSGTSNSSSLRKAVDYAWDHGVIVVAAAGNSGDDHPHYPAFFDHAIAVAAVNQLGAKASFSNYGAWVDLAAPGVSILSTIPDDEYSYYSGTSMATPHVAGVAALLYSAFPGSSVADIRQKLESSANPIPNTGTYWQFGLADAAAALNVAPQLPTPSPTPTATPAPSPQPTPTLTPTPSPTPSPNPTQTPDPTPSSTPTPTATPAPSPQPTPTPTPSPVPTPSPWWCEYIPWHRTCQ